MKKTLFLFSILAISFSFAQVGIGTNSPDPSTMLDVRGDLKSTRYVCPVISSTPVVNLALSNIFTINPTAETKLTLNNPAAGTYIFIIKNGATAFNVTFPPLVKWPNGIAPIATANKTDIVTLIYDGTSYYAVAVQRY